jgi:hypothetical protein
MAKQGKNYGTRLISHTGTYAKIIINLSVAEQYLNKKQLEKLNSLLVELNDVQEKLNKRG